MIKYILDNKEWVFSGIGVLFFSGIFILIRYLTLRNRKVIPSTIKGISEDLKVEAAQNSDISQFDVPKIMKSLDDIPPLQLEENLKKFTGLNINWTATYSSAYKKEGDHARIRFDLDVKSFRPVTLWCEVKLSDYKKLKLLKKNAKIRIIAQDAKFNPVTISNNKSEITRSA